MFCPSNNYYFYFLFEKKQTNKQKNMEKTVKFN